MARLVERLRAVAFDLDGTLVDSVPDLAAAANATLEALGRPPLPDAAIAALVGDGIDALVERALNAAGVPREAATLAQARGRFREHYAGAVFVESVVYPGVAEGLRRLAEAGLPLACVTNKASAFTLPLLDAAGLAPHFAATLCGDESAMRKPAPAMLVAACARFGVTPAALLYVGDSIVDAQAARAAGCAFAAVDYGYGRVDDAACDGRVAQLADILRLPDPRVALHAGARA